MIDGYDPKTCNALEKPFYRPVEAAIRWCGLIDHEGKILAALNPSDMIPKTGQFPQWKCLQANTEKILDAILQGDIPHGRDGSTVSQRDHVAVARLTVRHADLKAWMSKHYPGQKPAFLFDEAERNTHATYNADTFRALQAERDAALADLAQASKWGEKIVADLAALRGERDALRSERDSFSVMVEKSLNANERNTLLRMIAVLAVGGYSFDPSPGVRLDKLSELRQDTEKLGVAISDDTLRAKLKEAFALLPAKPATA